MKLIAFIVLSCLSVSSHSGQQAFLLENVPCNIPSCQSVGRMFHIHWDQSDLGAIQNAVMATFFDFYEDVSHLSKVVYMQCSLFICLSFLHTFYTCCVHLGVAGRNICVYVYMSFPLSSSRKGQLRFFLKIKISSFNNPISKQNK